MISEDVMKILGAYPLVGVRYNVVRRPLSGGKGTIVQREATQGSKCSRCLGSKKWHAIIPNCVKCGGSGRIGGKPAESKEEYFDRLAQYIRDEPDTYFMRWSVNVLPSDVERFRRRTLDPILEQLHDWWEWIDCCRDDDVDPFTPPRYDLHGQCHDERSVHFQMPYGVYSPLLDGGSTDLDEHLESGSTAGLRRVDNLFPEL